MTANLRGDTCKGDFPRKILDVEKQVDLLIKQARSIENLCQSYLGWCPYW